MLYLDTREPGIRFDERHLELLTAAAGIASAALANVRQLEWLEEENRRMEAALDAGMVGESPRMREIRRLLARVAATDSTVLLRGESGTGKEVAARALHRGSRRAGQPVRGGQLRDPLRDAPRKRALRPREGGLHRAPWSARSARSRRPRGARCSSTRWARSRRRSRPSSCACSRSGSSSGWAAPAPIRADVRVVAATNRDLEKAIREGTFREDLFYRLNVIALTLPALRERREDIPLLASHFAALFSRKLGRRVAGFTPEARACLLRYGWPGNVRELANAVERALVLGEGELIRPEDLPETVLEAAPASAAGGPVGKYHDTRQRVQKAIDPRRDRSGRRQRHQGRGAARPQSHLSAPVDAELRA